MQTNMPWAAFRSDRVEGDRFGIITRNAVMVAAALTPREAMQECKKASRKDRSGKFRYWVASSEFPVEETFA